MQNTLMVGLVFACLFHGGDHQSFDIRKFAGIWYHTAEAVNGNLPNELESVAIKAKIEYNGGIMLEIRLVRDGSCLQDVMFLAPTQNAEEFETIRHSKVQILEANFDRYCILHVTPMSDWSPSTSFMHLFTRTPVLTEDEDLNFQFYVGVVVKMDLGQIIYQSRTDQCPW